ncbi:MAG: hypothetical protein ACYC5O_06575 [Anaerolineae bacterium]
MGPDVFRFGLAGRTPALDAAFSNWPDGQQSCPDSLGGGTHAAQTGAVVRNALGYGYDTLPLDSLYHIVIELPHEGTGATLEFAGQGLQALEATIAGASTTSRSMPLTAI